MTDGSRMVFMTMRDDNASHFVASGGDIAHIGDDIVNSQHVAFGEH
ncbi:hypothetical protein SDC9_151636 [bioreactor metagenome]|uniref:Uncharacterized protein n=1 Tax=bioreactor metagenome TaxID=1076179 RepID=A0A645EQU7_9ZZZZ